MDIARLPDGSLRLVSRRHWLVGAIPIAVSLLLAGFAGLAAQLACRRVEPGRIDCTLVRSILGCELSRGEVRGLTGAHLGRAAGRTGKYRVELDARSGATSLTSYYSSGAADRNAIIGQIDRFVADERATDLTVREREGGVLLVVALVFLGAGLLASPLGSPTVIWTFDTRSGSLIADRRRPWGRSTTTHGLDQIRSAATAADGVALQLASGERLVLTSDKADQHAPEAAEQIRTFLGLPAGPDRDVPAAATFQRRPAPIRGGRVGGWRRPTAADAEPGAEPERAELPAGARPAPSTSGALRYASLADRLLGVVLFRAPAYRQVADDRTATWSALAIVLLVTAVAGFVGGMTSESIPVNGRPLLPGPTHGVARMLVEVGAGLVSWRVSAGVGSLAARLLFRGRTDTGEMLRVLGYASVFRLLWLVPHGFALSWLLSAVGTVLGVREAAEFDTPRAILTAAIAWVVAFAVSGIVWLLLTVVAVMLASGLA